MTLAGRSPDDLDRTLLDLVRKQSRQLREEKLVLYAGASLLNAQQRDMMSAELSCMPFMGPVNDKEQPGSGTVSELESLLIEISRRTFGGCWVDARLPSCTIANLAVFSFFGGPGTLMLGPAAADGGHLSQRRGGTPDIVGLKVEELPFDAEAQVLDTRRAVRQIQALRPKLVVLGRSVVLKPDDIEDVVNAAHSIDATVLYDASHVLGLIAGGVFPNPLEMGVDIITSSTYKTLRGPTGGIVIGRDISKGHAFSKFLDQKMLANQNASRFPAIVSAIRFCHPDTGYAQRVIAAARSLKNGLGMHGLDVLLPSEQAASHQVVVRIGSLERAKLAMRNLEVSGVLVGVCPIPGFPGQFGLRFGSQVAASIGLNAICLEGAAAVIADIVRYSVGRGTELDERSPLAVSSSQAIVHLLEQPRQSL